MTMPRIATLEFLRQLEGRRQALRRRVSNMLGQQGEMYFVFALPILLLLSLFLAGSVVAAGTFMGASIPLLLIVIVVAISVVLLPTMVLAPLGVTVPVIALVVAFLAFYLVSAPTTGITALAIPGVTPEPTATPSMAPGAVATPAATPTLAAIVKYFDVGASQQALSLDQMVMVDCEQRVESYQLLTGRVVSAPLGMVFVRVSVTCTNLGGEPLSISARDFSLTDSAGRTYTPHEYNHYYVGRPYSDRFLSPGESTEGTVFWIVPEIASGLALSYVLEPNSCPPVKAVWELPW